ncbi:MAG: HPr family phosphocarrier protein [Planctomycetes bacterium]|nr:HPr family phosphocarrier protein [Planctomycetota bacterium]
MRSEGISMSHEARATARVVNPRGLHARPCHALAMTALAHSASVRVRCGVREVDGRSILALMTLGASQGEELEFRASGDDAAALVEALLALVQGGFTELD